jgi:hypothetical protein
LVAIAVLLVIGVTIGATLLFTRDGDGSSTPPTSDVPSDIASANDTGPVEVITEEPTCEAYIGINNAIAGVQGNGWGDGRGDLGPATQWSPEQRQQVDSVATVMRNSTDQSVGLAKQTPHRVVRELYEQFIAYGRAYLDALPNYTPADNELASVNVSAGSALMSICDAITYGSTSRALAVDPATPPSDVAAVGDPANPSVFLESPSGVCKSWIERDTRFNAETSDWQASDSNVTSEQWTPEQKALQLAALPKLLAYADDLESLGQQSGNATFADFAGTAALYLRAYASSGQSYNKADSFLAGAAFRIGNTVTAACRASES